VIRLGSLSGYLFDGPRVLAGWRPPAGPVVYAVLYQADPERGPERFAVIYVGHSADLAAEGLPWKHPAAPCWIRRAGSKWKLRVAVLELPGGTLGHRETITSELISIYAPHCNSERYEPAWRPEWIGQ
jgi:hypothetical protein